MFMRCESFDGANVFKSNFPSFPVPPSPSDIQVANVDGIALMESVVQRRGLSVSCWVFCRCRLGMQSEQSPPPPLSKQWRKHRRRIKSSGASREGA